MAAELDEGWIADFLLHGDTQSPDATVYAAIRQLAPGAPLVVEDGEIADPPLLAAAHGAAARSPRRGCADVVEQVVEVLRQAVATGCRGTAPASC